MYRSPYLPSEFGEVRPPIAGECRRRTVFAFDVIDHQVVELVLALDVAVERGRTDPEHHRDPAHRHGFQAFGISQLHG